MRRFTSLLAVLVLVVGVSPAGAVQRTLSLPSTDGDDLLLYAPGQATDRLLRSRHDGTFAVSATTNVIWRYESYVTGDFNGDGLSDVIFNQYRYLKNKGDGTFYVLPFDSGHDYSYEPVVGDFDADGDSDLLLYGIGTTPDRVLLSNGDETFRSLPISIMGGYWPTVTDIDADGDDDVALVSRFTDPTDRLLRSRGDGTFAVGALSPIPNTGRPLSGDYDGDGRGDLLLYRAEVLLTESDESFEAVPMEVGAGFNPVPLDYDRDGDTDLFLNRNESSHDLMLTNRGDGTFSYSARPIYGEYTPIPGNFDGR